MGTILILLCVSIPIAAVFLVAFVYSARKGQFDDVHTPSLRMLKDDTCTPSTTTTNTTIPS